MDAYSYIGRGEVFANAQTGNMLLLGVHLSEGDIPAAIRYLCPVLAFTFGIALADIVRNSGFGRHLHWRQIFSTKPQSSCKQSDFFSLRYSG